MHPDWLLWVRQGTTTDAVEPELVADRNVLDTRQVVQAALRLIDGEGLAALTMRRLGQDLGIEAMSLYAHVRGREDLLEGVVDAVVEDLFNDPEVQRQESDNWQDYLARVARGSRRSALEHPHVFPLVATRPPEAPWLRPPLRSLAWVDSFLGNLRSFGFSEALAVYTYRAFTTVLVGHLLLEVAGLGAQIGPAPATPAKHAEEVGLDAFPTLQRLKPKLTQDRSGQEFEESLETLMERLQKAYDTGVPD